VTNNFETASKVRLGSQAAVEAMSAPSQLSCSEQTFERTASDGRLVPTTDIPTDIPKVHSAHRMGQAVAGSIIELRIRIAFAVFGRRHARMAEESAAERVGICEAAAHRHLLRLPPELQEVPRSRDARLFDSGGRRDTDLFMKQSAEVARAQPGSQGKRSR